MGKISTKVKVLLLVLAVVIAVCAQTKIKGAGTAPANIPIPIGTILPFAGGRIDDVGTEWKLCAGQSLRKGDYAALFKAIGTSGVWVTTRPIRSIFPICRAVS
jgi:hypothetical protein